MFDSLDLFHMLALQRKGSGLELCSTSVAYHETQTHRISAEGDSSSKNVILSNLSTSSTSPGTSDKVFAAKVFDCFAISLRLESFPRIHSRSASVSRTASATRNVDTLKNDPWTADVTIQNSLRQQSSAASQFSNT
jgi:hypothetical protein